VPLAEKTISVHNVLRKGTLAPSGPAEKETPMKLHPVDLDVKCPHCARGPLEFVSVYINVGDKYRCASCGRTIIHHRRKGTLRCGLVPLLGFGCFGTWIERGCESAGLGRTDEPSLIHHEIQP
jgi:ribosomal protein S27E